MKIKPIFKGIFLTVFTEIIALACLFFVYHLIAQNFGPEGVGKYALIRRVIGFLQSLLLLGFGIGLPHYIAASNNEDQRISYTKACFLSVTALTSLFLLGINLFRDSFAKIFFGNIGHADLVLPSSCFLFGLILHSLAYSYFRGRMSIKTFNLLKLIDLAIVPIIIFVICKNITIESAITLIGIIISLISLCFLSKTFYILIKKVRIKNSLKELLRYSLPRVPASFTLGGLFCLGPIFAAHFSSIQEVGYLSTSQNLIMAIGAVVAPLGVVLLPKTSSLISRGKDGLIKENLRFLMAAILQCSIFVCVQSLIFIDKIVGYWLGSEFSGAVPLMRIVLISSVFYSFYVAIRSILDAAEVKPLNTINISVSLGVFLLVSMILLFLLEIFTPIVSVSIAFSSGTISLGVLTYCSIRRIYPENSKIDLRSLCLSLAVNVLLGVFAVSVKSFAALRFHYLITFEIFLGIIYLFILWLLNVQWIRNSIRIITAA